VSRSACVDLGVHAVLALDGPDARRFLQGYVTCDVDALTADNALPGAFTNLQGRVIADLLLFELDGMPAFAVHHSVTARLHDALRKYLTFSKSTLVDLSSRYVHLGIVTPAAVHTPKDTTMPPPLARLAAMDWAGGRAIGEPGALSRSRLIVPIETAQSLWTELAAEERCIDTALWSLIDIASGIAHVEDTTAEAFLPQMLDLDRHGAISFTKGCYLGQEIVARAQHRGQVKRRLRHLWWRAATAPAAGTTLSDATGRSRATLLAAVAVDAGEGLALAVGASDEDAPLSSDNATFIPCASPR
jgi:tRNA-modifying protein YgfZ